MYQAVGLWQLLQPASQPSLDSPLFWTSTCWQTACSLQGARLRSDPPLLEDRLQVATASDPCGASHWTPICSPRHQRCPLSVPADLYLHTITNKAALQVTIKALLSVPQGDGSVHLIRGHPTLTQRKAGRLVDICYKDESDAGRRAYGQV